MIAWWESFGGRDVPNQRCNLCGDKLPVSHRADTICAAIAISHFWLKHGIKLTHNSTLGAWEATQPTTWEGK